MTEIVILGSGSGFAANHRHNSSIALLTNKHSYLLDCGEPTAALLFQAGIDPLSVKSIFITHLHPDHIGGLAQLLFSIYLAKRNPKKKFKPWSITYKDDWYRSAIRFPKYALGESSSSQVNLYIPSEGISGILQYLNTVYLPPEILPYNLNTLPIKQGKFYQDDNISAFAIANKHLINNFRYQNIQKQHPEIHLQSYSIKLEIGKINIVYSGDVNDITELSPLMSDVHLLIVEVSHYDPKNIKPFIDKHSPKKVVLTHIHPGLETYITELVNEWHDERVTIASDGYSVIV